VTFLLVEFRKCINKEVLDEINEMIATYNVPEEPSDGDSDNNNSGNGNEELFALVIICLSCGVDRFMLTLSVGIVEQTLNKGC